MSLTERKMTEKDKKLRLALLESQLYKSCNSVNCEGIEIRQQRNHLLEELLSIEQRKNAKLSEEIDELVSLREKDRLLIQELQETIKRLEAAVMLKDKEVKDHSPSERTKEEDHRHPQAEPAIASEQPEMPSGSETISRSGLDDPGSSSIQSGLPVLTANEGEESLPPKQEERTRDEQAVVGASRTTTAEPTTTTVTHSGSSGEVEVVKRKRGRPPKKQKMMKAKVASGSLLGDVRGKGVEKQAEIAPKKNARLVPEKVKAPKDIERPAEKVEEEVGLEKIMVEKEQGEMPPGKAEKERSPHESERHLEAAGPEKMEDGSPEKIEQVQALEEIVAERHLEAEFPEKMEDGPPEKIEQVQALEEIVAERHLEAEFPEKMEDGPPEKIEQEQVLEEIVAEKERLSERTEEEVVPELMLVEKEHKKPPERIEEMAPELMMVGKEKPPEKTDKERTRPERMEEEPVSEKTVVEKEKALEDIQEELAPEKVVFEEEKAFEGIQEELPSERIEEGNLSEKALGKLEKDQVEKPLEEYNPRDNVSPPLAMSSNMTPTTDGETIIVPKRRGRPPKVNSVKKKRGRPPKISADTSVKKRPGRPPKIIDAGQSVKKKPGRPPKIAPDNSVLDSPPNTSLNTLVKKRIGRPPKISPNTSVKKRIGRPPKISPNIIVKKRIGRPPKLNADTPVVKKKRIGRPPKIDADTPVVVKKRVGRPPKIQGVDNSIKKKRPGRPPKIQSPDSTPDTVMKRKPGRPPKKRELSMTNNFTISTVTESIIMETSAEVPFALSHDLSIYDEFLPRSAKVNAMAVLQSGAKKMLQKYAVENSKHGTKRKNRHNGACSSKKPLKLVLSDADDDDDSHVTNHVSSDDARDATKELSLIVTIPAGPELMLPLGGPIVSMGQVTSKQDVADDNHMTAESAAPPLPPPKRPKLMPAAQNPSKTSNSLPRKRGRPPKKRLRVAATTGAAMSAVDSSNSSATTVRSEEEDVASGLGKDAATGDEVHTTTAAAGVVDSTTPTEVVCPDQTPLDTPDGASEEACPVSASSDKPCPVGASPDRAPTSEACPIRASPDMVCPDQGPNSEKMVSPDKTCLEGATSPDKTCPEGATSPDKTCPEGATSPDKTCPEGATSPDKTCPEGATSPDKTCPEGATSPDKTCPEGATSPDKTCPERATSPDKTRPEGSTSPNKTRPERATSPDKTCPERATSPDKTRPEGSTSPDKTRPERATSPDKTCPERSTSPDKTCPEGATSPDKTCPERSTSPDKAQLGEASPDEACPDGAARTIPITWAIRAAAAAAATITTTTAATNISSTTNTTTSSGNTLHSTLFQSVENSGSIPQQEASIAQIRAGSSSDLLPQKVPKKRGRPPKKKKTEAPTLVAASPPDPSAPVVTPVKRKRGRPPKNKPPLPFVAPTANSQAAPTPVEAGGDHNAHILNSESSQMRRLLDSVAMQKAVAKDLGARKVKGQSVKRKQPGLQKKAPEMKEEEEEEEREISPEIPLQNSMLTVSLPISKKAKKRKSLESVLTTLLESKLSKNGSDVPGLEEATAMEETAEASREVQETVTGVVETNDVPGVMLEEPTLMGVPGMEVSVETGVFSSENDYNEVLPEMEAVSSRNDVAAGTVVETRGTEPFLRDMLLQAASVPVRKRKTLVGKQARAKSEAFKLSVVEDEPRRSNTLRINTSILQAPKLAHKAADSH